MHPGRPHPQPLPPQPAGSRRAPGWARKRVLIPGAVLTWFFGLFLGLAGAAGSPPDDAAGASSASSASPAARPAATTTVTETATPEEEPAPTVTETKKVKVRTTVTVTASAPAAADPGSGGSGSVHYGNCSEARAAGAAPVHRGEPGYGRHLDRDGDGVGCDT